MEDIRSILSKFPEKMGNREKEEVAPSASPARPTVSEIPDIFFDDILPQFKMSRNEVMILMYLYRQVWCRANLYRDHGIGPINSYQELAKHLQLETEEVIQGIRVLEGQGFISTVRAGQYFVRRYFTEKWDMFFKQSYEF